jgi:uncharacterized protein (UPF0332 family)
MTLKDWVDLKLLRVEAASADEIRDLKTVVETRLSDAQVKKVSADWRFAAAYNALLASATMALRASGYRVPVHAGQHMRTLESLQYTIRADDKLIRKLKNFANKRGTAIYEVAGAVSEQEVRSIIAAAEDLHNRVIQWFNEHHPELLQG